MSDFLLELGQNPTARKAIKQLGLPIPMPEKLKRCKTPWQERPLQDYDIALGGPGSSVVLPFLAQTVVVAGANPLVVGDDEALAVYANPGEAYGRPAKKLDTENLDERFRSHALVFDGTEIKDTSSLKEAYAFFHPLIRTLRKGGRIVVIGRPPLAQKNAEFAAAQSALDGFVRSMAKEIGKKGATAQLLYVEKGAEGRIEPVLRFVLSPRSAFMSGQPLHVSKTLKDVAGFPWVRPLEGKVALLTGAARGIGKATVQLLAAEGAHVVCLDRPEDDQLVSQVAREIGGSVLLADISDPEAPQKIVDELKARHGGVDIVIHNAGVTRDKTLARMKPEIWNQTLDINLVAVTRITRALLEDGLRDNGRIICLSSVAGIAGNMGQTNYAASKAGLIGFVKQLAEPLAKRGIAINAVAPGFIETRMTAAIPVAIREAGRRLSALGQGGAPQDIGEVITFLSTPGSYGLTGNIIRVCGGALIGA